MKKLFFTALLLVSTAAMAQNAPTTPPAASPPMAAHGATPGAPCMGMQHYEERFEERKARILDRLSKRAAEIQGKQSCVQAAANPEALKACFPHMERGGDPDFPDAR